jgi:multidrug resistance efflux pump
MILKLKIANLQETIRAYETLNQPVDDISIKLLQQINKLTVELQSIKEKLLNLKSLKKNWTVFAKKEGYILSINKKEGEMVKKFDPVMVMDIKTDEVYIVARFKVEDAIKIKVGNKAEVLIPSIKKIYKGKVVSIGKTSIASDSIVSETEAYALKDVPIKIKIITKDKELYSGMYAEVKVKTESRYIFIVDFISRLLGQ